MKFHVMTLFPEMIENAMQESITGRAIKAGHISVNAVNIRDFSENKHNRVELRLISKHQRLFHLKGQMSAVGKVAVNSTFFGGMVLFSYGIIFF